MGKKLLLVVATLVVAIGAGAAFFFVFRDRLGPVISALCQNDVNYWVWVAIGFFVPTVIILVRRATRHT